MKKELKERVYQSYKQYTKKPFTRFNLFKLKLKNPAFLCTFHIICGSWYYQKYRGGVRYRHHRRWRYLLNGIFKCGFPVEMEIGDGLKIVHLGGITVNQGTKIGKNFKIRQNTTIGNDGYSNENAPTIGDNVDVMAQCVIVGKITIGDNVVIGAGSVVVKDIPSDSMVVGNPARVIKKFNHETNSWEKTTPD